MTTAELNKKQLAYLLCAIVALAFIFFGNGIKGAFVYDDNWVINANPTLTHLSSIPKQFVSSYHYQQSETGLYRPLTLVSYVINFVFLGRSPVGFHVVNILLHAINAWLVLILIFKLFGSKRLAYITSALFLFLPIHVEAVTFISGRADLLAFTFALLALLAFQRERYWLGSVWFLLSLLSKESAVIFVPLALAFWLWTQKGRSIGVIFRKVIFFIPPAIIYGVLRYLALGRNFLANDASRIYNPLKFADPIGRVLTAFKVMTLYLWKTFFPIHLSADYSFDQIPILHTLINPQALIGLAVLAASIIIIFWRKTRRSPLAVGLLWFLASYFVISNFVFPIGTIMAERTFYLPSLGAVLVTACFLDRSMVWRARKVWAVLLFLICLAYGFRVVGRNRVWANNIVLYTNMIAESPASIHAKTNAGIAYLQANEWDKGRRLLLESYAIAPDHLPTNDALGIVAEHEHRYTDAERYYQRALAIKPHYVTSLSNLGRMYFQLGQYQKSADLYLNEFNYKHQPGAMLIYAMSMSKLGKYDVAIDAVKKYYGDNPKDLNLKFALGYAYFKKGDRAAADKYFAAARNPAVSEEEFIKSIENF